MSDAAAAWRVHAPMSRSLALIDHLKRTRQLDMRLFVPCASLARTAEASPSNLQA